MIRSAYFYVFIVVRGWCLHMPHDLATAKLCLRNLVRVIGRSFCPNRSFAEYVTDGAPTFAPDVAAKLDADFAGLLVMLRGQGQD